MPGCLMLPSPLLAAASLRVLLMMALQRYTSDMSDSYPPLPVVIKVDFSCGLEWKLIWSKKMPSDSQGKSERQQVR